MILNSTRGIPKICDESKCGSKLIIEDNGKFVLKALNKGTIQLNIIIKKKYENILIKASEDIIVVKQFTIKALKIYLFVHLKK